MGGFHPNALAAIAGDDLGGLPLRGDAPLHEEAGAVAEALHEVEVVGHDDDGAAAGPHLRHPGPALLLGGAVATANPSRMAIPLEKVFTGASMKPSSSAKATMRA
jgi:hypothetical protein